MNCYLFVLNGNVTLFMRKVLIIGPAPQNTGGISIHIRRLMSLLSDCFVFDIIDEGHVRYKEIFNLRSLNLYTYFRKVLVSDIVHIHSGVFILRLFHIVVCKIIARKQTIVTVHKDPHREGFMAITKFFLKLCDVVIMVNKIGFDAMKTKSHCKYYMMPAFLPPIMEDEHALPAEISEWIYNVKKNNGILMVSNAYNLVLNGGVDLYGLDLCIEMMRKMKENSSSEYYLLFVVASNTTQQELMNSYKRKITEYGIEEKFLIYEKSLSFIRLVEKSDIVLRTTNTDGDAISVREALYLGKTVIASDVVARPDGTVLFKTRDVNSLYTVVRQLKHLSQKFQNDNIDYKRFYLDIYNKL